MRLTTFLVLSVFLFSLIPSKARAVSTGDAVLTVAIATGSGAILGASTLPFYDESSAHTKNIFYGAAIGAVIGVLVAAYSGVQEGPEEEEALLKLRYDSQATSVRYAQTGFETAPRKLSPMQTNDVVLAWSPLKTWKF